MKKMSCLVVLLFLSFQGHSQQPDAVAHEDVVVTESRQGLICDPSEKRCINTQELVATVGGRKLELRLIQERKVNPLLALGTYPGQRVAGKAAPAYRLDEWYVLTYPDGNTEKFQVVGIRR